ncbi:MAG: SpoIIE family protein phosphatase [Candidatus Riflebacteria bacterium]|nr:SpoIIE family protein phosphatase [Candidatus Riflebacteria bacterium]
MKTPESTVAHKSGLAGNFFPLLIYAFCFLIFPLYIIYSGLEHLHSLKTSTLRSEAIEVMRKNLEQIEKYSSRPRYLHLLLKKIFDNAQAHARPLSYMQSNIENLKKQYPGDFEFIVWDAKGKIVQDLTDRKGYNYILSRLYQVLKEVAENMAIDSQCNIKELPLIKSNLNLVRKYLGRIFLPNHLDRPYLAGQNAGPLLTDFNNNLNSVWYHVGSKVSFLCFLSDRLLHNHIGLNKIVEVLNKQNAGIINGFSASPDITNPATPVPQTFLPVLVRSLAEFENLSEQIFETDKLLIMLDVAQPGIRSFSLLEKQPQIWSKAIQLDLRFTQITLFLLLLHLLLYFHINYRMSFISIRWKLTGLFLLANLAPLAILAFIAHDYLNNKKVSLRNEVKSDLLRQIRDFDMRYAQIKVDVAGKLNSFFDQLNQNTDSEDFEKNTAEQIKTFTRQFKAAETYFVSKDARLICKQQDITGGSRQNSTFIVQLGEAILKFNNGIFAKQASKDIFSSMLSPENADIIRDSYRLARKITLINLGNITKIGYWYIFGDRRNYNNTHILILIWDSDDLQEQYIDQYCVSAQKNSLKANFVARNAAGSRVWPENSAIPPALLPEFERAAGFRDSQSGNLIIDEQSSIFACARGRNLNHLILAFTYPESKIKIRVDKIRNNIVVGAIISLLLTFIIGHALSSQFLVPIHRLGEGALAIGAQNFRHRIPPGDEDEFGHLSSVFNRVIEGLGELEVARIVQESLLPGNRFQAGNFAIFGDTVVMTTLGGDYYDCLEIDDNNWGVVIGDVAGHGVPAGLMMAMAKSGVLMSSNAEKLDPASLLMRLHKIFFAIKNEKLKRMMTLQYFVFNPKTGDFNFSNAGHCFPLIVRPQTQSAEYIEHVATPLGIGRRPRYSNYEFKIARGEALILYTDGIAEANNANGEEFGYERLRKLLLEVYDPDPEVYYKRVYAAYQEWAKSADDDFTLIIINHNHDANS